MFNWSKLCLNIVCVKQCFNILQQNIYKIVYLCKLTVEMFIWSKLYLVWSKISLKIVYLLETKFSEVCLTILSLLRIKFRDIEYECHAWR